MSRILFLFNEAFVSLRRNILIVVGAILAVFISLAVAYTALVFNEIIRINTLAWQDGTHVIAFLNDEGQDGVPGDAHAALLTVRVRLEQQQLTVRRVATADESIQQLQDISRISQVVGLSASIVLGVAAVVLIANTIRLAIYARRDEVSIMKLVGASNWFIRVPFVMEGLFEGLVGAIAAVLSVWVFFVAVANVWSFSLFRLEVATDWFLTRGLIFLLFGALAGVLGSLLGLSRYLRDSDGTGPDVPTGF